MPTSSLWYPSDEKAGGFSAEIAYPLGSLVGPLFSFSPFKKKKKRFPLKECDLSEALRIFGKCQAALSPTFGTSFPSALGQEVKFVSGMCPEPVI